MCGICGIVNCNLEQPVDRTTLLRMRDTMSHRGPDDAGVYLDANAGIASRRLSIIDLSPRGHMPMSSEDHRYWITYNGELYNYRALRAELEARGVSFHSQTDTEVLLALYVADGPAMLARCNGMFAFAIWDTQEKTLFVARDRQGVKPLYYAIHHGDFYFASEEKALFAAGVPAEFDASVWYELLCFRYVAGERTPYWGVSRLLPGHYLILKQGQLTTHCWWSLSEVIQRHRGSLDHLVDPVEHLRELFEDSIALRRISDVPVGILLSGGMDSSSIAAIMAHQAGSGVASFTVRFAEHHYDEGLVAQQTAQRWQLDHHETFVQPEQIPALLEEATWLLDEPLVHGNDVQLLAISRYAKPKVTVLLSGEGSDEIMGGYVRYRTFLHSRVIALLGGHVGRVDKILPQARWRKIAHMLSFKTGEERLLYSSAEIFPAEMANVIEGDLGYRNRIIRESQQIYREPIRQVMFYEQHTYLQSILDRNDRTTMGASIECREPYLDYRLVEWVAKAPTAILFRDGQGKMILRDAMKADLSPQVLNRSKWGFGVPWHIYMRDISALRRFVEDLPKQDIIATSPLELHHVQKTVSAFLAGDDRQTALVRELMMTALWYQVCIQGKRGVLAEVNR